MRNLMKGLLGATAGLALTVGALSAAAGSAAAAPATGEGNWSLCRDPGFANCTNGPSRGYTDVPRLPKITTISIDLNDNIQSLRTGTRAIETWNDYNFQGTYGYWAPNSQWSNLSYPYSDAISSMSRPGV